MLPALIRQPGVVRELILVTQGAPLRDSVTEEVEAAGSRLMQVDVPGPFNFSTKINAGVAAASGSILFLLNDDTELGGEEWPGVFVELLADPQTGAVGPVIVNPDGSLNAAGDTYSASGPRHIDAYDVAHRPGLANRLNAEHAVGLLTAAAMAIRRTDLLELGGFDEAFPSSFGDTDVCLRIRATGRRLVCTPRVKVIHRESSTRDARVPRETQREIYRRHPQLLDDDPLLPPMVVGARTRLGRTAAGPLRVVYRVLVKPLMPKRLHYRLWHAIVSRGFIR